MLCRTKKSTSELEQPLASGDATWRLRATAARRGGAGRSQQRLGERRAGELEGHVVGLERRGAAGSVGARRRGAAVSGVEQQGKQRGRGERKTMRTSLYFSKRARGAL
jgi:hypothetical protein